MSIEEIAKEARKGNGNKYIKNNDLLWYLIKQMDDVQKEVGENKGKIKMLMWSFPIFITLVAIAIAI